MLSIAVRQMMCTIIANGASRSSIYRTCLKYQQGCIIILATRIYPIVLLSKNTQLLYCKTKQAKSDAQNCCFDVCYSRHTRW